MKTVFLFSGQGSQYYHMGGKLFDTDGTFRKKLYELDEIVRSIQGGSLVDELYGKKYKMFDPFLSLELTHPAIFMSGYALTKVLEEQGILPDYLLGSSLGEFIAAAVSGAISAEDALRLVIRQAEIIKHSCPEGRMVAVLQDTSVYHANPALRDNSTLAAINGPAQFVIAGEAARLHLAKKFMKESDILHQELMVAYGFHSPAIAPAEAACRACFEDMAFRLPAIPVMSGVSGSLLPSFQGGYFWDIVRQPTSFDKAIRALEDQQEGVDELMYIDLGPSGSLANLIKYNIRENSRSKGFQIMSPFKQELKKLEEVKKYYKENKKSPGAGAPSPGRRLLACLFPGQGSQKRGMGEGLFEAFPELTHRASEILGYSVAELCVRDPDRRLNKTEYTQPALYVVNALSYLKWKEDAAISPDFVAGHSLGEYNALLAAGGMDFETGLRLVRQRGALMAQMQEGGMAAVKGLSAGEIEDVIQRHGMEGIDMANYNTHNQIVLSGPKEVIAKAGPCFEKAGATLYFVLNVSGAFHSRYMLAAKEEFQQFLQSFHFSPLMIPVVSNVAASFYQDAGVSAMLADQLIKPVRWTESIQFLLEQGDITFKEVGPGDVLTKLVWSIQRDEKEILLK